jgi:small-conductance mechanosensitive channel
MENKIKEEQLTKLQGLVNQINQLQMELGQVESRKYDVIAAIPAVRKELNEFQSELEKEYGNVSINIQDGTIKEVEDEANPKD